MNLSSLLPEIGLGINAILAFAFIFTKQSKKILHPIMLISSLVSVLLAIKGLRAEDLLFFNTYRIDAFSQFFKFFLSIGLVLVILISDRTSSIEDEVKPEFYLFLSTATLGMLMLTSATELITIFISLELASMSQYILVPMRRGQLLNAEAGIKYLLFGAAASALTLYGISFLFGCAKSTYLSDILAQLPILATQGIFYVGLSLTLAGFFFKLALFPFHFWAPDVYEAASTQVTTYIATVSKCAAIAILVRVMGLLLDSPDTEMMHVLIQILVVLSILSMSLGNLVAIIQKDVKRMLAYSSIAQAGYVLAGLLSNNTSGHSAAIFYIVSYLVMNFAAFLVVSRIAVKNDNPQISDFSGLADKSPLLALILMISLLSLAGIPPLVGFTGKWFLFNAAMAEGHWILVFIGVINSVVSLYYYLMIVKEAYLGKPDPNTVTVNLTTRLIGYGSLVFVVFFGIFPTPLIEWISKLLI